MIDTNGKKVIFDTLVKLKSVCQFVAGFLILLLLHLSFGWVWLAMFAFRHGVMIIASSSSAKFVRGLGRPWKFKDVLFLEDYYNQRHRESPVEILTLQGDISCTKIRQLFTQNVLQAKINQESSSKLKFPELAQMRSVCLGFLFWMDDPSFKIEDHISEVFYGDPSTPDCFNSLENMMEEFTQRPYLQNTSPWEIWVVRNFPPRGTNSPPKTVLLWRCHHSFADGYSVVNILINSLGQKTGHSLPQPKLLKSPAANPNPSSAFNNIFSSLVDFAVGFWRLQLDIIQNKTLRQKMYAERLRKKRGVGVADVVDKSKVHFKFSPQLSLPKVKAVAAQLGARVPVLLTTLAAHNFAKILHLDLATTFYASYVLPLANHPDTLANHMALGGVHLPLSNSLGLSSRLKLINSSFLRLSSDPANRVISYLEWIVGNSPGWIVSFLKRQLSLAYTPLVISNIVWASEGFQVGGVEVEEMLGGEAPTRHVTDAVVLIQGYGTHIRMTFAVNDCLYCEEDVERIVAGIGEDFDKLLLLLQSA